MTRIRRILIAILIVLVLVGAHQLWDYIEVRRLAAEIEAVIAKGEPVTETQSFTRRAPQGNEDKDAGAYYLAAGLITHHTRPDPVFPVMTWLAGATPEPSSDHAQSLNAYVEKSREALALADKAAALGFVRLPPGTEYNYRTSHVLGLSRLLSARTLSLSWADQGDAAVASAISSIKLRRPIRELRWPLLYSGVNHETAAVLSLSHTSDSALLDLQRALESEDARDDVVDGLLADRARAIEEVWRRSYGPDAAAPGDYRPRMRSVMQTIRRPLTTHRAVTMMRMWAKMIEAVRKPWPDRMRAVAALDAENGPLAGSEAAHMFLFPAVGVGNSAYELISPRMIVIDRASITAIAVERFRRDNGGALPEALTDLTPRYLATIPADPYSGSRLLYAKDDASYTIYSVGPNKTDDRGDLISEFLAAQKKGYGPRPLRGTDLGVRVMVRR